MPGKTLGIDLGTNSIGWAIISRNDNPDPSITLLDQGVHIFQEGVAREKNNEKPAVQDRTEARGQRRKFLRHRLRKIEVLKVLINHDLCPGITLDDLADWKNLKLYPKNPDFLQWQRTDDNEDKNPYHDRHKLLNSKIDLSIQANRYTLGRAIYHLSQRRGFLSNRKDPDSSSDGVVKSGIDNLTLEINEANCNYPGEYFFHLYQQGLPIRKRYQHRLTHVEAEFHAICERQQLSPQLTAELHRAIFFQRPLKSQKGSIGHCTFEKNKQRCALSHPEFEEFRMLSFINNIKVKPIGENSFRSLIPDEIEKIKPLFFSKTNIRKGNFEFKSLAKKIAGRAPIGFKGDGDDKFQFNFRMEQLVAACPVTAHLKQLFGDDYVGSLKEKYINAANKSENEIVSDIWHVLFTFDSEEALKDWAIKNLTLNETEALEFAKIRLPQGYASLSLKAIRKIIPFLRQGLRYDEAIFMANIPAVFDNWNNISADDRQSILTHIKLTITEFTPSDITPTIYSAVKQSLEDITGCNPGKLNQIYHPSKIDKYPDAEINEKGELLLGSPRTEAIRNPMAMRALFRLRHLINTLLKEKKIDRTTRINIEFSRMLNDANMRSAIKREQAENEKTNETYRLNIKELYLQETGREIEPTQTDILKYALWEEQNHKCLYTNQQIAISDFLGDNPTFDIEHTIPRSLGGDNSKANKTLCCQHYNRNIKLNILPANLPDSEKILQFIDIAGWNNKIASLQKQIAKISISGYLTKEQKDKLISQKNYLKLKLKYWTDKVSRFSMTEVPAGFSNRQGVDIGIIGKYAYHYLSSLFKSENRQIFTVKGATTAEFRTMWGLQEIGTKKERSNHTHHAIDAIVIACIGRNEYHQWAEYNRALDQHLSQGTPKPTFDKPWPTFTEDVKQISENLIVAHHFEDRRLRHSKKILRKRGKIQHTQAGDIIYLQGDTARARLHKDTFYGAICHDGQIKYVIRKSLSDLTSSDINNIVDPVVRQIVLDAVNSRGLKNLSSEPIYLNKEKNIEIKRVRILTDHTSPIKLKQHRDLSTKEHKQSYYVANDSNYCMGIYTGQNQKGKNVSEFHIVNILQAVTLKKHNERILPLSSPSGLPLRHTLTPGKSVIFFDKSPSEVYNATPAEISRRLYKIQGLSFMQINNNRYGIITLRHHQNALPSTEFKFQNGRWVTGENIRDGIKLLHTQFNALVQGEDFTISSSGTITFLHPNI